MAIDKRKLLEGIDPEVAAEIEGAAIEANDDYIKITITTTTEVVIEGKSKQAVMDAAKLLKRKMFVSRDGMVCKTLEEARTADSDL